MLRERQTLAPFPPGQRLPLAILGMPSSACPSYVVDGMCPILCSVQSPDSGCFMEHPDSPTPDALLSSC